MTYAVTPDNDPVLRTAWDKARHLKAQPHLDETDRDRSQLIDALKALHSLTIWDGDTVTPQEMRYMVEYVAILRHLSNAMDESRSQDSTEISARFAVLSQLMDDAINADPAATLANMRKMQIHIDQADEEFRQWFGNPLQPRLV